MAQDEPQGREPMSRSDESEHSGASNDVHDDLLMAPDEMLDLAQMVAELLVNHTETAPTADAWDGEFRDGLESALMEDPPELGRPAKGVIERAAREIFPYAARLEHPRFFGFVPSSPTWPGIIADFMAAGYNVNVATWLTASGPSQVELVVIDWFRRWLGYPEGATGILTSGGSVSSVDAFVAAREAAGNPERATVYMSDQSHVALRRAAMIIGVPAECVRTVRSDGDFRLDMEALRRVVADDRAAGFNPIIVCANAGTVGTGAVDLLEAMADYCESEGIWLHADAAYGGFAVVTEAGKKLLRGIERADSVGLDAHKWFFQPYEAGCLMVKDAKSLEGAFGIRPDILQDTVWGANHPNFTNLGLQVSRSFRALKVWMSVQVFGMAAFRKAVASGIELAAQAETYIGDSLVLENLSPQSLGIVCFRVNPDDAEVGEATLEKINRNVLARVFWEAPAFMASTMLDGKFALRLCILNHTTAWEDVRETLEVIEQFGREALG